MPRTLLAVGLLVALLGPVAAAYRSRSAGLDAQAPRRAYDLFALVGAALALPPVVAALTITADLEAGSVGLFGGLLGSSAAGAMSVALIAGALALSAALGVALPVAVWRWRGLSPRRVRRGVRAGGLMTATAVAEEVVWRAAALLLLGHLLPTGAAVLLAGIAFLSVHGYLARGWRGLAYLACVTVLLWSAALAGGLLCAIALHVAHNTVLLCTTPVRRRRRNRGSERIAIESSQSW